MLNFYDAQDLFAKYRKNSSSSSLTTTSSSNAAATTTSSSSNDNLYAQQVLLKELHKQRTSRKADVTIAPTSASSSSSEVVYSTAGAGSGNYGTRTLSSSSVAIRYPSKIKQQQDLPGYFYMPGESFDKDTGFEPLPDLGLKLSRETDIQNLWQIMQIHKQFLEMEYDHEYIVSTRKNNNEVVFEVDILPDDVLYQSDALYEFHDVLIDFWKFMYLNIAKKQILVKVEGIQQEQSSKRASGHQIQKLKVTMGLEEPYARHIYAYKTYINWCLNTLNRMYTAKKLFTLLNTYLVKPFSTDEEYRLNYIMMQNQYDISIDNREDIIIEAEKQMELYLRYRLCLGLLRIDPIRQFMLHDDDIILTNVTTKIAELNAQKRFVVKSSDKKTWIFDTKSSWMPGRFVFDSDYPVAYDISEYPSRVWVVSFNLDNFGRHQISNGLLAFRQSFNFATPLPWPLVYANQDYSALQFLSQKVPSVRKFWSDAIDADEDEN